MSSRKELNFNSDWRFSKGDFPLAWKIGFEDENWRNITLPHDFSVEGSFSKDNASGTGYLPGGIGWYRKRFTLDEKIENKKVFIQFNGVYNNSQVWVNGNYLGKRPYGYSSFSYDVTEFLREKDNVISVKFDHSKNADSRWYTGSGIYRDVTLVITNQMHIKEYGTYVYSEAVNKQLSVVHIENTLKNESPRKESITIINSIKDSDGKTVKVNNAHHLLNKGEETFKAKIEIENPKLWSIDAPHLYELKTVIFKENQIIDEKKIRFGIRTIEFDPDKGFFLNHQNMKIKGVCIHHDAGCLGAAVPKRVWERRFKILKEMGCNAIRMSHNPPDPIVLDLCDEMGFLAMDEAFDEWEVGKNKWVEGRDVGLPVNDGYYEDFPVWAKIDLRDMVLRDRNHPSIIMWSIGNEIDFRNDPYTHELLGEHFNEAFPHASRLGQIAKNLVKVVKEYDTTRPVTAALATAPVANAVGYSDCLDVVGYNYQEGLYEEDHKKYPKSILYGSENGKRLDAWKAVLNNDYICAQFIWTGVDFLGEASHWPNRNSRAGFLDLAGFKKPIYFERQSWWSDQPVLYLTTTVDENKRHLQPKWNYEENQTVQVNCFTNCEKVELFLNEKSLGVKYLKDFDDLVLKWEVQYETGVLKAVSDDTTCELITYGKPKKIHIANDPYQYQFSDDEIVHLEVNILDQDEHFVYDAKNLITCEISENGKVLGIENGDANNHEDYQSLSRSCHHGKCLVYVKRLSQGDITLTVTSKGLDKASIVLK